jgi:hypothetical protein
MWTGGFAPIWVRTAKNRLGVAWLDHYAILLVSLSSAGQGFKLEGTYLDLTS